ncbi:MULTISPECIES: putative aminohydrolase SsnA [Olsenella]|uniref:putative aminohydrolase SsnA n=1 Tax=Olsenella TaxID=133925 RepID=UPI000784A519|nr:MULTISPECIES: putative aminohydrolase SsnA [Olsenella]KXB64121.1 putative chlorohydrolase/aminohydrolase [Olsenella sp. DNF00959]
MLLVANGRVITRDEAHPYFEDGAVVVDGTKIVEVGDRSALEGKYPDAEFLDARGAVIMPGLINAHTHIYSGLARGLAIKGCNPTNFLENLEQQWWKIDRNLNMEGTRASAYATILDCIRDGVTTIFDHHASFLEIPGSLFAIKDVAEETGMRACLCYETSDRDGEEKCDQAIAENAEFARWAAGQDSDMIAAMFGGHALFTLSDKTLDKMVEANDGLTGFHIHVCEGMNDVYDSLGNHGCTAVHRLLDHGLLGEKTMLGHCIHITPADMDVIAETKTMIVNNPGSNMNNAVGCAPVLEFFKRGITVGMGTDAYTHDVLESLKTFIMIQRHNSCMPNVAWGEDMAMLFKNNRTIAEKYFSVKPQGKPLGILAPGAAADIAIFDYKPFTPFSDENIDGHILFGFEGKACRTTIINGRVLYKDREFVDLDEEAINARILAASKQLWGELNGREY